MATEGGDDSVTELLRPGTAQTAPVPKDFVPEPSPLALIAAGPRKPDPVNTPSMSLTTAADAMRNEEIERTRLFIIMGWVISIVAIAAVPFLDAPRPMAIVFVGGLVFGIVVSIGYYRAFADPKNYTEGALVRLAVMCVVNGHFAVLFYGTYTAAPIMIVAGIHFIGRTELRRVARWIQWSASSMYAALSILIISGLIEDPGVFASDRPIDRVTLTIGSLFVLGGYWLAYYTAGTFRTSSISAIEDLQRATRLASQREALMEELRADLERALRVGGPGRYTDHVVGKFKLGMVLGRGAMGEVYEATHADTGEQAAVKLLRREMLADTTQVARFLREAKARIDSPYVVRVLDASAESPPYLAMERLHGQTLAEQLRREPRLGKEATLALCTHAARGVDAAAAAGVVHRDLKPQNLFCCADGTWKILDFGVATLAEDTGTLTQGDVVGTPHYMAPEQAQGQRVDSRADLYAIGAIAYRCLTGRYPFTAADTPALLYAVVHRMPARPSELAELDADVDRWFAIAIAKSPEDRFASGAELADSLAAALAGNLDPKLRKRGDVQMRRYAWEPA